jgi:hypothetical protein
MVATITMGQVPALYNEKHEKKGQELAAGMYFLPFLVLEFSGLVD